MPLWRIAWRSIQRRALASSLTTLSMALGVMLVVAVLLILGIVQQSFRNSTNLGYDLLVGNKGGKLQLVLNTIYHMSEPIEALPYDYYQEFLSAGDQYRYFRSFNSPEKMRKFLEADLRWRYYREFLNTNMPEAFFPEAGNIKEAARSDYLREFVDASEIAELLLSDIAKQRLRDNERVALCHALLDASEREEFLSEEEALLEPPTDPMAVDLAIIARIIKGPSTNGRYAKFAAYAIPMCMGDYYQGMRVVGTTPQFFDRQKWEQAEVPRYQFAQGRNFHIYDKENGYFEAVLGARAAKKSGLQIGDHFSATHGPEGHSHDSFVVVGILKPTGAANDQALFINMEGFYLLDGHAKPVEDAAPAIVPGELNPALLPPGSVPEPEPEPVDEKTDHYRQEFIPLSIAAREVTAFQVRTTIPTVLLDLHRKINEGDYAQGVMPVGEIVGILEKFIRPMEQLLLLLTGLTCVVSGIGILVSIYNSMSDRRREIAVIRALGASRGKVMGIVLLESVMLSLGGGLIGWVVGHGAVAAVSGTIEEHTGVAIRFFDFAPPITFSFSDPALADFEQFLNDNISISGEILLIPGLIILAILVGFLPAFSAYKTDVAEALSANP